MDFLKNILGHSKKGKKAFEGELSVFLKIEAHLEFINI
jgi:hypothetical protein